MEHPENIIDEIPPTVSPNHNNRKIFFGIAIILLCCFLVVLIIAFNRKTPSPSTAKMTSEIPKKTTLSMQPVRYVYPNNPSLENTPSYINIVMNTHGQKVQNIQFTIQYDPLFLTHVTLNAIYPQGFLPHAVILADYVNTEKGLVTFSETIPTGSPAVSGKGILATLVFQLPKTSTNTNEVTAVSFVPNAQAGSPGIKGSIIQTVQGVIIPL